MSRAEGVTAAENSAAPGRRSNATLPLPNELAYAIVAFEVTAVVLLQNAVRHAHAHHAHVELHGSDTGLTLTVTDDGTGFDPDDSTLGVGRTHMTDRAEAAGGTLTVDSRPGNGTTISLTLPTLATVSAEVVPKIAGATP